MPIPFLPNELVDQILSYIDPLNPFHHDLVSTSLVCRNWLEPSRKYLYRSVNFVIVMDQGSSEYAHPLDVKVARYSESSWRLLSTVGTNSKLASLVKNVSFRRGYIDLGVECSAVFVTTQTLIATVMGLLTRATSFRFDNDEWFNLKHCGAFFPHLDRLQTLSFDKVVKSECFGPLSRLPNLRSLELSEHPLDSVQPSILSQAQSPFVSRLQKLFLLDSSAEVFDALCAGSKSSLRKLKIPLNLLPKFHVSEWPSLTHLSICHSSASYPSSAEITSFLSSLRFSCPILDELTLSREALSLLEKDSEFDYFLPRSCIRINLTVFPFFETALSFVHRGDSHPGIRELRLYDNPNVPDGDHKRTELVLAGLRALLEKAGVELIWYWDE
ncbi:F-box protein [Sporobolomyces salmoneus]|uniref:F-box protein n=1 Tax=Sporobolomyces salmoneus TaxID=183962 RepID=UPI0031723566